MWTLLFGRFFPTPPRLPLLRSCSLGGRPSSGVLRACTSLALALGLALGALLASPSAAQEAVSPDDLFSKNDFPQFTYYRVARVDMRLCPSPLCGGVFIERVNRRFSKCADGMRAKECHAAEVDFSALGLSPEEEARLRADFFAKRVLARGELELVDVGIGIEVPTLIVSDAWRGVTGTQGEYGRYFGIMSSGIVCVTSPCPSFHAYRLNLRRMNWLHHLNFHPSGATPEQIESGIDALASDQGLIGFGILHKFSGPAGRGNTLYTTEFYTKVERGNPAACGGFTYPPNPACEAGEFCEAPPGTCYVADLPGTCQEVPEACIEIYDPVCGCNGVTYSNDCHRRQNRVALDHVGACTPFPPVPCGPNLCTGGTVCCNPLAGICTPPDGFCTF